ncbi:hypothetical protein RF11_15693 [Thelohanellus kitauei]|uniref:Uncharacterized protein n=1 Tax=Thelohanellus kitauei TaxID=669202 RepID=A0A0C2N7J5_THEKT|nr:hypothetical protein RF11_15693 [Thelohanellus kitauei]
MDSTGSPICAVLSQKFDEQEIDCICKPHFIKSYLLYIKFKIRSDPNCLKYLSTLKELEGQLERRIEQFEEGGKPHEVDALLRPNLSINVNESEFDKKASIFDVNHANTSNAGR